MLEQWDAICQFIKDLEKDNTRKPKSINFKRAAELLATGERNVTRVMLEFLRSTVTVFEKFLCCRQSGPPVHVVYDAMGLTLQLKLMRRFVQADQLKDVHDSALQSVSEARQTESNTPWHACVLGGSRITLARQITELNNRVLKDLGYLNPLKREHKSTTSPSRIFQGNCYQNSTQSAAFLDEWKLIQKDGDTSDINTDQRVDHYWNAVFLLTSVKGNGRHQLLPRLVKSCLVLAQSNADSERSLSVNARVVMKEKSKNQDLGSRPLSACGS